MASDGLAAVGSLIDELKAAYGRKFATWDEVAWSSVQAVLAPSSSRSEQARQRSN